MYQCAREYTGMSREEAAFRLNVAPRTLAYYEAKKGEIRMPPPDVVLKMSEIYDEPMLTLRYCRECPIGQKYSYVVLDNVNLDPATVLLKLQEEYREAGKVLDRIVQLTINKNNREDFKDNEWREYMELHQELWDLEHNIEIHKACLARWCDVGELIEDHNRKCRERGYVKVGVL